MSWENELKQMNTQIDAAVALLQEQSQVLSQSDLDALISILEDHDFRLDLEPDDGEYELEGS